MKLLVDVAHRVEREVLERIDGRMTREARCVVDIVFVLD